MDLCLKNLYKGTKYSKKVIILQNKREKHELLNEFRFEHELFIIERGIVMQYGNMIQNMYFSITMYQRL